MKKLNLLLIFLIALFFLPKMVFAKENISIESLTLDSKSDNTEIVSEATFENLSIKFDLKFFELNDFAKYKVVINNQSNKDYEITENSNFTDSEYITYEYSYEDGNNIAEKNSKTTMYITIKYNVEVPNDSFEEGSYVETNNLVISLGNDNINNPNTKNNLFIILLTLLLLIGISIILLKITKKKKYLTLLVISIALLPISIYAIERLQINVESKVEIQKMNGKVCVYIGDYGCSPVIQSNHEKILIEYNLSKSLAEFSEFFYSLDEFNNNFENSSKHIFIPSIVETCEIDAKNKYLLNNNYNQFYNEIFNCYHDNIDVDLYYNEEAYNNKMNEKLHDYNEGCYLFTNANLC